MVYRSISNSRVFSSSNANDPNSSHNTTISSTNDKFAHLLAIEAKRRSTWTVKKKETLRGGLTRNLVQQQLASRLNSRWLQSRQKIGYTVHAGTLRSAINRYCTSDVLVADIAGSIAENHTGEELCKLIDLSLEKHDELALLIIEGSVHEDSCNRVVKLANDKQRFTEILALATKIPNDKAHANVRGCTIHIASESYRSRVLSKLPQNLPIGDEIAAHRDLRKRASDIVGEVHRSTVLRRLAEHLPIGDEIAAHRDLRERASNVVSEYHRSEVFSELAGHLPVGDEIAAHRDLRERASDIAREFCRSMVFRKLAEHLPVGDEIAAHRDLRERASDIASQYYRSGVLSTLDIHLPTKIAANIDGSPRN